MAPLYAEPATTRPPVALITARSQSPDAAVRRAVTAPAEGMVTRFWTTPAPLR